MGRPWTGKGCSNAEERIGRPAWRGSREICKRRRDFNGNRRTDGCGGSGGPFRGCGNPRVGRRRRWDDRGGGLASASESARPAGRAFGENGGGRQACSAGAVQWQTTNLDVGV